MSHRTDPPETGPTAGADAESQRATAQRRTIGTLVVTQAFGGVGVSTGIAVSSLLAASIVDDETLSGLPQTAQVVGSALLAFVLVRVMVRHGRRPGLALGYALAAAGAGLCVLSAVVGSFLLLLLGALLIGSATSANNLSRYTAVDLADSRTRGRALSIVVWATTIGAVLGPNLVGPAGDLADRIGLPPLAGPFLLGMVGLLAAAFVALTWLRPDPLLLARALVATHEDDDPVDHRVSMKRVWRVVSVRPRAMAAVVGMAAAHTVMVAVMVMTPLHMDHGGASLEVIGFVISMHVLGMFAFSPIVGWLADLVGRPVLIGVGGVTLLFSVTLAGRTPGGASTALTWGLFLLGLGWSCVLIASSALLVDAVPFDERPGVQGAADLVMGLSAAAGGALAGWVVGTWGYDVLNAGAGIVTGLVLAAAVMAGWRGPGDSDQQPSAGPGDLAAGEPVPPVTGLQD